MLIDLAFVVLMILAVFKGYRKGFIIAIFSLLAFIIGLAAALKLSSTLAFYLQQNLNVSARWLPFLAFLAVFIGVALLVRLGGRFIEMAFKAVLLGWLNRIAGILLFATLYTIILSVFIFYGQKLNLIQEEGINASVMYPYVQPWGPKVIDGIGSFIPLFKDMFTELGNFFEGISNKISH